MNCNYLKPFQIKYSSSDVRRAIESDRICLQIPTAMVLRVEAFREIVQANGTKRPSSHAANQRRELKISKSSVHVCRIYCLVI